MVCLLGMVIFCSLFRVCYSESEVSSESKTMSEEMLLFQEIPSVYGTSKYEQKVTDAPSSVSIITADEIKKYGYRNFADSCGAYEDFTLRMIEIIIILAQEGLGFREILIHVSLSSSMAIG